MKRHIALTLTCLCATLAAPAFAKGEMVKAPPKSEVIKPIKPAPKGIILSDELETI